MGLMEQMAARSLPPGTGYRMDRHVVQEKIVGKQMYIVFGLGAAARLSGARRAIRELVRTAVDRASVPLALVGPVAGAARRGRSTTISMSRSG